MEQAMRHEQLERGDERNTDSLRLPGRRVDGDHDLTHQRCRPRRLQGKGQDVGPARDPAPGSVEPADLGIVHEENLDLATRAAQRRQRALSRAGDTPGRAQARATAIHDDARH